MYFEPYGLDEVVLAADADDRRKAPGHRFPTAASCGDEARTTSGLRPSAASFDQASRIRAHSPPRSAPASTRPLTSVVRTKPGQGRLRRSRERCCLAITGNGVAGGLVVSHSHWLARTSAWPCVFPGFWSTDGTGAADGAGRGYGGLRRRAPREIVEGNWGGLTLRRVMYRLVSEGVLSHTP